MLEEKGVVYKTGKFTSDDITKVLSIKVRENSEHFLSLAFLKESKTAIKKKIPY